MAKIKIFNVSGRVLKSETRSGPVRLQVGGTLDLNSHMDIGPLMKEQLDSKLLKLRTLDQLPTPAPKKKVASKKKAAKKKVASKSMAPDPPVAPAPKKQAPPKEAPPKYDGLTGDNLVMAVMKDMIAEGDNLGRDKKPNQPVLEERVQAISPNMKVDAKRRNKLFAKI